MSILDMSVFEPSPQANPDFTVCGDKYRITVLTERMLRLEYSENGCFEDRATRVAVNRCFDTPKFNVYEEDGLLHITTKHLHLAYDKKEFTATGMQITVDGNKNWYYTQKPWNLPGTVRTLDRVNGSCPLDPSFLNRSAGIGTVDDSKTLAIGEDGWPVVGLESHTDIYFFGYVNDYEGAVRDFYRLSAPMPLIPRYAFGNWWSRYHVYTDSEYLTLMDKFKEKDLPFSVAIIDMDWHLTSTPDPVKYGSGWTGYTWNRELFPDHKQFLCELHKRGLMTSLNLHPRDGIRAFEEVYPTMCERLGLDASEEKAVEFDASSKEFMQAYFDTVLNPMEEDGVDFWWIDWQQSGGAKKPGYDVLWMLNHCHYVDNARRGNRPLLFSRYAGIGSHRYPLGFSGDTHITWESLDFQPYFTACASNIGYSMWSHDIGGHMQGYHDPELYTRWVQLGVFSPINRLHSSPSAFSSKEPWNYGAEAESIASEFLRLRHALIPYIYTHHYNNYENGIPLIRPVYHKHPTNANAYRAKNNYYFGDSMLVAPITAPRDPESSLAKTEVWLPHGTWIDFFNGRIYSGDRTLDIYRPLSEMPVFVRAGSIIPLAMANGNSTENPKDIDLRVYAGADGEFTLIEDNDKTGAQNKVSRTHYTFSYADLSTLTIEAAEACEYIPEWRNYHISFAATAKPVSVTLTVGETEIPLDFTYDEKKNTVSCAPVTIEAGGRASVSITTGTTLPKNEIGKPLFDAIMNCAHLHMDSHGTLRAIALKKTSAASKIAEIMSRDGNPFYKGYACEILSAND